MEYILKYLEGFFDKLERHIYTHSQRRRSNLKVLGKRIKIIKTTRRLIHFLKARADRNILSNSGLLHFSFAIRGL